MHNNTFSQMLCIGAVSNYTFMYKSRVNGVIPLQTLSELKPSDQGVKHNVNNNSNMTIKAVPLLDGVLTKRLLTGLL